MRDPYDCTGCHSGHFADFDHFCDVLQVRPGEYGQAFAAWMAGTSEWDGDYSKVEG